MPKLDKYHDAVKNALVKDGWTITNDPFTIDFEDATLFADLAAERTLAAQKDNEKITDLFDELKNLIGEAKEEILGQSKKYLKT